MNCQRELGKFLLEETREFRFPTDNFAPKAIPDITYLLVLINFESCLAKDENARDRE